MANRFVISAETVLSLSPNVVIEDFGSGALALETKHRILLELNETARYILAELDGQCDIVHIGYRLCSNFDISETVGLQDVMLLLEEVHRQGFVKIVDPSEIRKGELIMTATVDMSSLYVRNPDVGLREEDEDGGLLFNPDTNEIKVLNSTGMFIWNRCNGTHSLAKIVQDIEANYDDVPDDQVRQDVQEFVETMLTTGFIGTVDFKGKA